MKQEMSGQGCGFGLELESAVGLDTHLWTGQSCRQWVMEIHHP